MGEAPSKGRFQLPSLEEDAVIAEIDGTTLAMILGGVDLKSAKRRGLRERQLTSPVRVVKALGLARDDC